MSEVTNPTEFQTIFTEDGLVIVGLFDQPNRFQATADAARMQGGDLGDTLSGNTVIYGLAGPDSLVGGDADNQIYGNEGNDTIYGLDGNDLLYGGQDNDLIYGGDGNDAMGGDKGNDTLVGGTGNDTIRGNEGEDWIQGGEGNDFLFGEQDNDTLQGGDGNDTMYGGQGNDLLQGGDGDDFVAGDRGSDTMTGGAGADTFAFTTTPDGDTVTDFVSGTDSIALRSGAGYNLNSFQTVATAADAGGLSGLVYIQSTGVLLFNGEEVATFAGSPEITASDFELF
jgi:Ca2+-binding RTX toxin-like protein